MAIENDRIVNSWTNFYDIKVFFTSLLDTYRLHFVGALDVLTDMNLQHLDQALYW